MKKTKKPYVRDVFLAKLIEGAKRTENDEFPVIEKWMVATKPPKDLMQWNQKAAISEKQNCGICFYCDDDYFQSIIGNPEKYYDLLNEYECIVGMDASPYHNMPLCVQKSQIFINLAFTYYFGKTKKIIPNVRLGDNRTLDSLDAYPKNTLIAIGMNGFYKNVENRDYFKEQMDEVVNRLSPSGIVVYGKKSEYVFEKAIELGIPIYQYDSYIERRNKLIRKRGSENEG